MSEAGGRWQRRKQARPGEILEAALTVFARHGFAAARMDAVAREAGIAKGTLYLYFPDKETLFKALVREAIVSTLGQTEILIEHYQGPSETLLADVVATFRDLMHRPNVVALPKLVIAEAGNFPELAQFYLNEVIRRGLKLVGRVIERGVERGEFRPLAAQQAAPLVLVPVLFSALWRSTFAAHDPQVTFDPAELLKLHVDVLLHGLKADAIPEGRCHGELGA